MGAKACGRSWRSWRTSIRRIRTHRCPRHRTDTASVADRRPSTNSKVKRIETKWEHVLYINDYEIYNININIIQYQVFSRIFWRYSWWKMQSSWQSPCLLKAVYIVCYFMNIQNVLGKFVSTMQLFHGRGTTRDHRSPRDMNITRHHHRHHRRLWETSELHPIFVYKKTMMAVLEGETW